MVGDIGTASVRHHDGRVPRVTGVGHVSWGQELALGAMQYHVICENQLKTAKLMKILRTVQPS